MLVVDDGHFNPCWCIDTGIGIAVGIGKSLACITVESMTSPIVITKGKVGSSILMKCLPPLYF